MGLARCIDQMRIARWSAVFCDGMGRRVTTRALTYDVAICLTSSSILLWPLPPHGVIPLHLQVANVIYIPDTLKFDAPTVSSDNEQDIVYTRCSRRW